MPEHPPETRPEGNTTQPPTGYSFTGDPNETTLTTPHTPAPTRLRTNQPDPSQQRTQTATAPASNPETPMGNAPPSPGPTEVRVKSIMLAPGPVSTPYDAQLDYNVHPLPNNFNYRVKGILGLHLRLNLSEWAKTTWESTPDSSVIIIPLFMSFSLAHMQEVREDAKTLLGRAFPDSEPTITIIPAAKKTNIKCDEAPPWGTLVAGLKYCDAATLLHYQFWLSKKLCFMAYPASPFMSDWLGNWAFAAKEKDQNTVLKCLHNNLSDPTTTIGAYLATNIPDPTMRQGIIQSAHAHPLKVKKNGIETIHWSLSVHSPHPDDIHSHHKWVNAAKNTDWYHCTLSSGEFSPPPHSCKCCKGHNHTTNQCPLSQIPLWQELFPPKLSNNPSFDKPDMSIPDLDRLMAADHDTTSSQNPSPGPSTRNGLRQPNHSSQTSRKPHGPHGGCGGYGGHGGNGGRGG